MTQHSRQSEAGFTLMETLVALAVLAVGSMGILTAVERHASTTRGLEDRIVARWVAENALAATTLGIPTRPDWTSAMSVDWRVRTEGSALPNSGLRAVTVLVADALAGPDATLVVLTGYVPVQGGAE